MTPQPHQHILKQTVREVPISVAVRGPDTRWSIKEVLTDIGFRLDQVERSGADVHTASKESYLQLKQQVQELREKMNSM